MADIGLSILLLWHIGSVVIWLGSSATFAFGVSPTLVDSSLDERRAFLRTFFPRFSKLLGMSSISTVAAGTVLFGYVSSVDSSIMPVGWRFILISIGAVLGLVAIILSVGVVLPLGNKFTKQGSQSDVAPNDMLRRYKYSNLDEEATFNALSSTMKATVVILGIIMTLMILGVAL